MKDQIEKAIDMVISEQVSGEDMNVEGLKCPKCGSSNLSITGTMVPEYNDADITFEVAMKDGVPSLVKKKSSGSYYLDSSVEAKCLDCGWEGTVDELVDEDSDEGINAMDKLNDVLSTLVLGESLNMVIREQQIGPTDITIKIGEDGRFLRSAKGGWYMSFPSGTIELRVDGTWKFSRR